MSDLYLIRTGSIFRAADEDSQDKIKAIPQGVAVKCKVTVSRNYQHHKKLFALLNLCFDYWEPKQFASTIELATVDKLADYLKRYGVDSGAVDALTSNFVSELTRKRSGLDLAKNFEQFRDWITVQAGFYDDVITPSGVKRIPKSISFGKMDQTTFDGYYRQVLSVCWSLCLSECFDNQEQLAEALLSYE